jgi:hypothetical protein
MTLRGRHWIFLWLMLFLGTALAIATRQTKALATARRLATLQDRRIELEGKRTELLRQIGQTTSREVLVPRMERAGMHLPSESENFLITLDSLVAGAGRGR